MPFAQLVLGSPGSGKSTYCDGSKLDNAGLQDCRYQLTTQCTSLWAP